MRSVISKCIYTCVFEMGIAGNKVSLNPNTSVLCVHIQQREQYDLIMPVKFADACFSHSVSEHLA